MLDFASIRDGTKTFQEIIVGLTCEGLRNLTNEMINTEMGMLSNILDTDVIYIPEDPDAHDPFAQTEYEIKMPWTLGHVIVHVTASSEESAFLSAELARGIIWRSGRSRYEVPWQTIKTVDQCRDRLEESRHIRLGCLDAWPDIPHLNNTYNSTPALKVNAVIQFVFGLFHEDSHLDQIKEILNQAKKSHL